MYLINPYLRMRNSFSYSFSHVNFPSQFRYLCKYLADRGHDLVFIASNKEWHAPSIPTLTVFPFKPREAASSALLHPYLSRLDKAILNGQACAREALSLRDSGWYPDVVISHVGFGNGLFLRDCFPKAKRIGLVEWF